MPPALNHSEKIIASRKLMTSHTYQKPYQSTCAPP